MGILYLVPTPIGNLEDITLRALRILREVSLIAAEDTRTTRVLLQHYDITTPLTSYHEHNKLTKLDALFAALETGDVALVSDAGTPSISDPGYELVSAALGHGVQIVPLPGANAITTALVASGIPTDSFTYLGFLPRKMKALTALFDSLTEERRTLVAYESPNRIIDSLKVVLERLGDRPVCVAREVSKFYEEFQRGACSTVLAYYQVNPPRGEITLIIGGAPETADTTWDAAQVHAALNDRVKAGDSLSHAAKAVAAESGWSRRDVYALGVGRE